MPRLREFTRIKHSVLMDIFARGLLTKREMQIAFVIIRESWGWDGGESNWTKRMVSHHSLSKTTQIERRNVIKTIRSMLTRKILLKNDKGQFSFNEHIDTWGCQKDTGVKTTPGGVSKQHRGGCQNNTGGGVKMTTNRYLSPLAISKSLQELHQLTKLPKERFKERFKETLKEMPLHLRRFYEKKIKRKLRIFDDTRKRMILVRLEKFSLKELKQVVINISHSPWHMGTDSKSTRAYNDFELLFRNDRQVEKYLNLKVEKKEDGRPDISPDEDFEQTGYGKIPSREE